jgi:ribosomal-protein-alanine N-acetyltransferase
MVGDAGPLLSIETPRLVLEVPSHATAPELLRFFVDNRAHLERWEPTPLDAMWTEAWWHARIEQSRRELLADQSMRFVLRLREDQRCPVIGHANFTQFFRGPLQGCVLGYSIDGRFEGRGLMSEALEAAIAHVFDVVGLHRIAANHLPENLRSARLLRRLGFVVEGYARDYLWIDGAWRDHVLTALTNPSPKPPSPTRDVGATLVERARSGR